MAHNLEFVYPMFIHSVYSENTEMQEELLLHMYRVYYSFREGCTLVDMPSHAMLRNGELEICIIPWKGVYIARIRKIAAETDSAHKKGTKRPPAKRNGF